MSGGVRTYDFIDALRGLAILGVLAVHSAQAVSPSTPALKALMAGGARGVQLFFVVSTFTLFLSWMQRSTQESLPVRNFFIRRFFRVGPPFYLAIASYLLLYGMAPRYWAPNGVEWWFVLHTALFINGFHPETINAVVPGGWSIAAEMTMYAMLPFLFRRITTPRAAAAFVALSLAAYGVSRVFLAQFFGSAYPPDQAYLVTNLTVLGFFGQLPVFAFGICLYFAFLRLPRPQPEAGLPWLLGSLLLVVLVVAVIKVPLEWSFIAGGAVLAVFALALAYSPSRLLVNRATVWLGKISFSMYLWQFAVLEALGRLGGDAVLVQGDAPALLHFGVTIVAVTAVSSLTYVWVERPCINFGARLIDRGQQSGMPARG